MKDLAKEAQRAKERENLQKNITNAAEHLRTGSLGMDMESLEKTREKQHNRKKELNRLK